MPIEYNELLLPGSEFLAIDGATKKMQTHFHEPIQSIINISSALGDLKKKKEVENDLLFR